ncbi:unnamed protein product [Phaedon cochleariae]|uniref:BZIP domain-containing protein n=1 Tax=Phaedon cochleariae TaxID=80249 RepID=A0A9P0DTD5_PHACE|nr:unnamed protein product [Phaedon cochleariae]
MSSVPIMWKEEPASPLSCDEASLFDVATLYQATSFEHYDVKFDVDLSACETKAEIASQILDNLENLMDLDDLIKDEPFLLDDKILPTILDDVPPPRAIPVPSLKAEYAPQQDTQYLLGEFDTIYHVTDLNPGTLTPPQSPPSHQPMLTTLQPLLTFDKPETYPYMVEFNYPPAPAVTPQPDIAHELAVVEELVRTRVEDMQWSTSPGSPESSSSSSNFDDSSSEDPEWVPEPVDNLNGEECAPRKRSKGSKGKPEEKKVRKKEQNKNAATRYRMKKKAEVEVILHEEKEMLSANTKLSDKVTDLEREIKYLKGLMRDLFKAKGLIN